MCCLTNFVYQFGDITGYIGRFKMLTLTQQVVSISGVAGVLQNKTAVYVNSIHIGFSGYVCKKF